VLDADVDLAEFLHEGERDVARHSLIARAIHLAPGDWTPSKAIPPANGHLGVLVLEGILCREVAVGTSCCAELVGPGDLLRPWDGDGGIGGLVSCDISWQVLEETRLAVLDRSFVTAAARWPALTTGLVARAIDRSKTLALAATIRSTPGLETRLLMLFWHMADRWGRVRPDGVVMPVRLTHELIARMVGARRPSVSTALKQLEREGVISRLDPCGWLLTAEPPLHADENAREAEPPAEPSRQVGMSAAG
jgi:hypothetical protein